MILRFKCLILSNPISWMVPSSVLMTITTIKGDPEQGEQKALAEFLQKQTRVRVIPYMDYAPLGKSFICRVTK